jgi:two-component system LytT family response regulator
MKKLKILIVDDEALARARIRSFLSGNSSVEIAGECSNGTEALAAIREGSPDIVFLDVEMPGCTGAQVLEELPAELRPAVVMTTAHDRFAVEAFSHQVTDFLLKPFDRVRFDQALFRASELIRAKGGRDLEARIEGALAGALERQPQQLVVKVDGRLVFLKPSEIVWVEAESNYATLHLTNKGRLLLRETLTSIERRLSCSRFVRVNRSALVNVNEVQELQPFKYGDYQVLLRNGHRLPLSRNLRGRLREIVERGLGI